MHIGLVGWGVETKSAYGYFGSEHRYSIFSEEPRDDFPSGDNVQIHHLDQQRAPGLTANVRDLSYLDDVEACDKIILTPTAKKTLEKVYPADHDIWSKVTTTLHLFFETCPSKNIIGVTGTKGKGTTSALIAEMLKAAGKTVHLGGNIGVPLLDLLEDIHEHDWVVLELSSFQLYKFPYSPHIAVHLMMRPEHIDEWHKTMDDYIAAKRNIFAHQSADDMAIFKPDNEYSTANVAASPGTRIPYWQSPGARVEDGHIVIDTDHSIIDTAEVALPGTHNLENVCAALTTVWQIDQNEEAYRSVIKQFRGLEHRLQFVRELDDVRYYNDSFGTTPDTAIVAMDAFDVPKVMIIGGHDKGNDFTELYERLMQPDVRSIVCIGTVGAMVAKALRGKGYDADKLVVKDDSNDWTIQQIIQAARERAQPGDVVLLSTGTSSFGLFKDYKERGRLFTETVLGL